MATGSFMDTTEADFTSGSPGAGSYIAEYGRWGSDARADRWRGVLGHDTAWGLAKYSLRNRWNRYAEQRLVGVGWEEGWPECAVSAPVAGWSSSAPSPTGRTSTSASGWSINDPPWAIFSTEVTGTIFQARSHNGITPVDHNWHWYGMVYLTAIALSGMPAVSTISSMAAWLTATRWRSGFPCVHWLRNTLPEAIRSPWTGCGWVHTRHPECSCHASLMPVLQRSGIILYGTAKSHSGPAWSERAHWRHADAGCRLVGFHTYCSLWRSQSTRSLDISSIEPRLATSDVEPVTCLE